MARTLTAGQEAERVKDGVSGVWTVVATWDEFGEATTTKRWASRAYTLSSNTYAGIIAQNGLDFGMLRIKPNGGLAPVYSWTLKLRDEEAESTITDTHVVANDEVIVYFLFPTGSETDSDRIEVMRGVVERNTTRSNVWTLKIKDDSKKDLIQIPTTTLDPVTYPYAYSLGAIIPECFGNLNIGPDDVSNSIVSLARCRTTDRFALTASSSLKKKTGTTVYQWYSASHRFAKLVTTSELAGVVTVDDPARIMWLRPSRPKVSNDVSDWYDTVDSNASISAAIVNTDNLDVWLSGSPKLGAMTALSIKIKASGSYNYTIYNDTTSITGPTGVTGDTSYALTLGSFDDWALSLLNVEIDGTGNATIEEIYLQVEFDDFLAVSDEEPDLFQIVSGWEDLTTAYNDGAVVNSSGSVLRNPVNILQALLRGSNLNNLPAASVDSTSFTIAEASRSSWNFDFVMDEQVSDQFLDKFCFEAGLYLWNIEGQWKCAAMDKSRVPEHFFHGGYHMPIVGSALEPMKQQYDLEITPVNASSIFNEIAIRYAPHPATSRPQKAEIASGQYRLTGTANTVEVGSTLTDASATFVTNGVIAGEHIYVSGDTLYSVTSITSETILVVAPVAGGAVTDGTSVTYYLGPNIDGDAFVSQQAYKVVNALGGNRQKTFLDDGGFKSQFIRNETTAGLLKDHAIEWFSQPRDRIKFSLSHDGILVEPGDFLYLDHPKLKSSQRATEVTLIIEAVDSSETVIDVTAGEAGLLRADDYIYLQESNSTAPECMKIISVDTGTDQITVTRATLNTKAQTFSTGVTIYHVTEKWVVTGVKPLSPTNTKIQIEAEEVPPSYFPVGVVVIDAAPDYSTATASQRAQSGFASLRNGRQVDTDPSSAISFAG